MPLQCHYNRLGMMPILWAIAATADLYSWSCIHLYILSLLESSRLPSLLCGCSFLFLLFAWPECREAGDTSCHRRNTSGWPSLSSILGIRMAACLKLFTLETTVLKLPFKIGHMATRQGSLENAPNKCLTN